MDAFRRIAPFFCCWTRYGAPIFPRKTSMEGLEMNPERDDTQELPLWEILIYVSVSSEKGRSDPHRRSAM